nr:hypothetical protein Iba_chr09fCG9350 [Ipomoea batatas]
MQGRQKVVIQTMTTRPIGLHTGKAVTIGSDVVNGVNDLLGQHARKVVMLDRGDEGSRLITRVRTDLESLQRESSSGLITARIHSIDTCHWGCPSRDSFQISNIPASFVYKYRLSSPKSEEYEYVGRRSEGRTTAAVEEARSKPEVVTAATGVATVEAPKSPYVRPREEERRRNDGEAQKMKKQY